MNWIISINTYNAVQITKYEYFMLKFNINFKALFRKIRNYLNTVFRYSQEYVNICLLQGTNNTEIWFCPVAIHMFCFVDKAHTKCNTRDKFMLLKSSICYIKYGSFHCEIIFHNSFYSNVCTWHLFMDIPYFRKHINTNVHYIVIVFYLYILLIL